jgi:hypothetical protein
VARGPGLTPKIWKAVRQRPEAVLLTYLVGSFFNLSLLNLDHLAGGDASGSRVWRPAMTS